MTGSMRVGFIGVGLMGHGMAKNIVEKGFPLTILAHRNRAPVEDLIGRGATEAKSPAELAARSDLIFTCVTGSPQVEDVILRADGVLAGLRPGGIVADSSTAEPDSTLRLAAAVEAKGGHFIDTPLIRTPIEAEQGRLVVIAGGATETLAKVQPVLDAFAEFVVHAGGVGAGHRLKLINNYLGMAVAAATAESVITAMKTGVDLQALNRVVTSGGADSVMFRRFAKYFLEGDDSLAKFAIGNAAKDVRYFTHMAESAPATAFIAEAVHQTYQLASLQGYGGSYLPHLIDALAAVNAVKR